MDDEGTHLRDAIRLLRTINLPVWSRLRREARAVANRLAETYCLACGRMSEDCSADPCCTVIEERAA